MTPIESTMTSAMVASERVIQVTIPCEHYAEWDNHTFVACTVALLDGMLAQVCILARGMSGHPMDVGAGQMAADTVCERLHALLAQHLPEDDAGWQYVVCDAITAANRRLYDTGRYEADRHTLRATLTMGLLVANRLHLGHVGAARAYLLDNKQHLLQLTIDHSLAQRLVDSGAVTSNAPLLLDYHNVLYGLLGEHPMIRVDTRSESFPPDSTLLLCSGSLGEHSTGEAIVSTIAAPDTLVLARAQPVVIAEESSTGTIGVLLVGQAHGIATEARLAVHMSMDSAV